MSDDVLAMDAADDLVRLQARPITNLIRDGEAAMPIEKSSWF